MSIQVVGLNHKSAPIEVREKLAFSREEILPALNKLREEEFIRTGVLLSTCNRTEIYYRPGENHEHPSDLFQLFWESRAHNMEKLGRFLYDFRDRSAVEHGFRVAGSLDSMIVGETQILAQVKQAYQVSREGGFCGKFLHQLFQDAFHVAKEIRTHTEIARFPASIGSAAVALAQQIFGDLHSKKVLVIGGGKMARLCLDHLREEGVDKPLITNRTLERAQELADKYNGTAHPYDQRTEALSEAEIVLSSTGSPEPILTRDEMDQIQDNRGARPLFIIDIAVPRDVDEALRDLENLYLYNIDDLEGVVDRNLDYRESEKQRAEQYVEKGVQQFQEWLETQDMGPVIRELKQEVYQLVEKELRREFSESDPSPAKSDLQLIAHRVTNKLLNDPVHVLKEKAIEGEREVVSTVRELFDLDEELTA